MIDSDTTGQRKLDEVRKGQDTVDWSEYEEKFLHDMQGRTYAALSDRQKSMIGRLHDKLMGR